MNRFLLKTKSANLIFGIVFYSMLTSSAFSSGITGTYTGTYSGSDSGTITIFIDVHGNVLCNFHSTVHDTDNTATGSVNADPTMAVSFVMVVCANNGIGINSGQSPISPGNYHPYFAARIEDLWYDGQFGSWSVGTWFNSNGDGGQFSLNLPPTPNAATDPVNPAGLSGLWYDPNYTGSGFNLTGSNAGLIVTYYGWDKSGNRLWLTSASPWTSPIAMGQSITLDLLQTADGTFSAPAPPSTGTPWGTLTLTFTSCTAATATLSGADGNIAESLGLLVGLNGVGCQ